MNTSFGPWSTAMATGNHPELSTFWKRRMTMLCRISRDRSVVRRRTLLGLVAVGVLTCLLPTLRNGPARAEQGRRQDAEQAKLSGRIFVNATRRTNGKTDDPRSASARSQAEDSTPLKGAVTALNEKAAEYLAPSVEQKYLSKDQLPEPLTVEEVVAAIRSWKPENTQGAKAAQPIYQRIVETKVLPPRAQLDFRQQWVPHDGQVKNNGKYEYLMWRTQLDVYTSETTGYGLPIRTQYLDRRVALKPSPGYSWIVNPYSVTPAPSTPTHLVFTNTGDIRCVIDEARDGSLLLTASWLHWIGQREFGRIVEDLRAVGFDESGKRYLLDRRVIGAHSPSSDVSLLMARFRLDPSRLPARKVRHLGFEALSTDGLRIASEAAVRQARDEGIEILPFPELDRPYDFALTTTDGKVIDSKELRGKVILIDCWASWCGPCMRQMPALKGLYDKWHGKGLEVVGVSFDQNVESAETAYESLGITWPLVVVPSDQEVRELWRQAARIPSIPRYLVIDQQGVLRAHEQDEKILEQSIAALFQL